MYDWITATINSKIIIGISAIIIKSGNGNGIELVGLKIRSKRMCPDVIFAVKRKISVIGRAIHLINSIKIMNGIIA